MLKLLGPISAGDRQHSTDSRLRLQTIVRLRWFAVAGQLSALALVALVLGFDFPIAYCLLLVAASAWLNVYLRIRFPSRHRLGTGLATVLLAYDVLQLAALLLLTGGLQNPFALMLVAPVTVSAATLPAAYSILLGVTALGAGAALLPELTPLPWYPGETFHLPLLYKFGHLAAIGVCMVFLGIYVARLSRESRQMSAALTATELVLAREQKLHALDGLAAAAAHELGTPLATIVLVTKELQREVAADSPLRAELDLLSSQAARCREILGKLTRQPSEADPLHSSLTLGQLVDEAAAPHKASGANIEIMVGPLDAAAAAGAGRGGEPVGTRRPGIVYGLANLIENAVDFARSRVEVGARWNNDEVIVTVTDDGPGFPIDLLESIGDPYVTSRPTGGQASRGASSKTTGLGLGFFIAKTLLERSGASVELANQRLPATGAIVTIRWRRAAFEERQASATA